jgi:hypothetical protein
LWLGGALYYAERIKGAGEMSIEFASSKFGTAISILASHPGRIQERLRVAYSEALSRVPRTDIPEELLPQYDSVMSDLTWVENSSSAPSDDEARLLVTRLEDLSMLLEEEARHRG